MRRVIVALAVMSSSALLWGCSAPAADPVETSASVATAKATATATPRATPTSIPSASPLPAATATSSCDTMLTPAGYEKLANDGLLAAEPYGSEFGLIDRFTDEGIVCRWGKPQSGLYLVIGQLPIDEADWFSLRAELLADGFTVDDTVIAGYIDVGDSNSLNSGYVWRDGTAYFISSRPLLEYVPAFEGEIN